MSMRAGSALGVQTTASPGAPIAAGHDSPLLDVRELEVDFRATQGTVSAVRDVSFSLNAGESLAILGESGSGKSVTSRAILGLVDVPPGIVRGSVTFDGEEIVGRGDEEMRDIRGPGMSTVFQDSLDSLNPVYSVGAQISEVFRVRGGMGRRDARVAAEDLMRQVGIEDAERRLGDFPHEFSGGMRQRVCIALAVALQPRLLVADEPTTALDVTVQAGILELIARLQRETSMALIFVTHDLGVARTVASGLIVMYAGQVVEQGPLEEIYARPAHPYTRALLQSHPAAVDTWQELRPIGGSPPTSNTDITGCSFHPRCPLARERCRTEAPALRDVSDERWSRCHYAEEVLK